MNSIQRVRKFLSGFCMLLGSLVLAVEQEDGFYVIAIVLCLSLLLEGIRSLIYYFTMARNMVGGKPIFYRALILMDLGFFTMTAITIPSIYLTCHLLISYGFSGIVDMLKAYEDKKMEASSWRLSFVYGFVNLLISLAALSCAVSHLNWLVVDIYSAGLAYSGIMQIVSAFRRAAIIYIP